MSLSFLSPICFHSESVGVEGALDESEPEDDAVPAPEGTAPWFQTWIYKTLSVWFVFFFNFTVRPCACLTCANLVSC